MFSACGRNCFPSYVLSGLQLEVPLRASMMHSCMVGGSVKEGSNRITDVIDRDWFRAFFEGGREVCVTTRAYCQFPVSRYRPCSTLIQNKKAKPGPRAFLFHTERIRSGAAELRIGAEPRGSPPDSAIRSEEESRSKLNEQKWFSELNTGEIEKRKRLPLDNKS